MFNLKTILKLFLLTPISALVLSCIAFTILNYPRTAIVFPNSEQNFAISDLKKDIDEAIQENNKNQITQLTKNSALEILQGTLRINVAPVGSNSGSVGTGILIKSDLINNGIRIKYKSYVITNYHVVREAHLVKLESFRYLDDKYLAETIQYSGKIVAKSPSLDLALIEINSVNTIGRPLQLYKEDDLDNISLYEPVYICGCSLGDLPSITNGNLSQMMPNYYNVTAFSIFGNSGGGTFTFDCKILGITRRIFAAETPDGIGHPLPEITQIIPSTIVRDWLKAIKFKLD